MAITNPEAIKFTNEVIRPLAERVRAIKAIIDDATVKWAEVAGVIPNDALEMLEDGREAQGISRLSGKDIRDFVAVVGAVHAAMPNDAVISKPTVRPIEVS